MTGHIWIIAVFTGVFFSILFIQSALDKIFNWKSELEFNTQHFSKTFLKPTVPLMLAALTIMELTSGLLSAAGVCMIFVNRHSAVPFCASCLSTITFIMLFFGQRVSKDYAGAQSLVSYFILAVFSVYFSYPVLP
jgi:hypothetical protein